MKTTAVRKERWPVDLRLCYRYHHGGRTKIPCNLVGSCHQPIDRHHHAAGCGQTGGRIADYRLARVQSAGNGGLRHVGAMFAGDRAHGYVPNLLAGGLVRRTRFVAAIVPAISNQIFSESIQSLTDACGERLPGAARHIGYRRPARKSSRRHLSRRPDGFSSPAFRIPPRAAVACRGEYPDRGSWDLTPTPIDMLVVSP